MLHSRKTNSILINPIKAKTYKTQIKIPKKVPFTSTFLPKPAHFLKKNPTSQPLLKSLRVRHSKGRKNL